MMSNPLGMMGGLRGGDIDSDDGRPQGAAQTKALELAEYVAEIQKEIERVARENKDLRKQYFGNLEDRYSKVFAKTNKLFMMSMFAQWKMCSQNSQFQKELQEAEGTFKDEKEGYQEHVAALESSYDNIHKRNVETRSTILSSKMEAEDLQKRVMELKRRVDNYREQLSTNTSFINSVKLKLDSYKPRYVSSDRSVPSPKDATSNPELELMKREMHFILSRIDPYYVKPLVEPNVPADYVGLAKESDSNLGKAPAGSANANNARSNKLGLAVNPGSAGDAGLLGGFKFFGQS